jgi:hypothetical protein
MTCCAIRGAKALRTPPTKCAGRVLFDEDATPCAPSVSSATRTKQGSVREPPSGWRRKALADVVGIVSGNIVKHGSKGALSLHIGSFLRAQKAFGGLRESPGDPPGGSRLSARFKPSADSGSVRRSPTPASRQSRLNPVGTTTKVFRDVSMMATCSNQESGESTSNKIRH